MSTLLSQEDILVKKMLTFYSNPRHLSIFIGIVEQRTVISLRLLDWFSTNYSKFNRIYIDKIDIHSDYKNKLDGYKKARFDPFCRKKRIFLYTTEHIRKKICEKNTKVELAYKYIDNYDEYMSNPMGIVTTVGQLNFFMWCMEKNILDYIINNFKIIEKSMSETYTKKTAKKKMPVAQKTVMNFTISF